MTVDGALSAVLQQLALAHDHWEEEERFLVAQGREIEAQGAHELALACLKAYRAELENPEPAARPEA